MVTCAANSARYRAAWPAEFAPPTDEDVAVAGWYAASRRS